MQKKVKELKAGEFFKLTASGSQVFVMGVLRGWKYYKEFDCSTKKYEVTNFNDISAEKQLKGDKKVFVGFEF